MVSRLVLSCAVCLLITGVVPRAQDAASRVVSIDFFAADSQGRLVDGLTAADLDVRIDGRVRVVSAVRRIAAGARAATTTSGLPAPFGTSADSASGRLFVFVLDQDSFRAGREGPFRNAVAGLLSRMVPTDYVTVIGMPYGGVVVPVTNDHQRVRHAIELATGQRALGETGSQMACRTRLVLESLETLLKGMAGRSEPTTLVLLTAGLAAPRRDAPMALAPGMCELQTDLFRRVATAAGAARANFYIAQPDDIVGSTSTQNETISGSGFTGSDNPLGGIEDLAGTTRGVRLPLTALGDAALTRVDMESSAYYVVDIESQLSDFDPRSRRVDIRVTRPDVAVRARPEITFTRPRAGATRLTVSDMLLSAATFSALPMRVGAFTRGAADGMVEVVLVSETNPRGVALASAGAVLVDGDGTVVGRWNAVDAGESPLVGALRVKPGRYRLRAAAVDTTGRGGAADYRFEAGLIPVGQLSLGSLVLGLSRDGRLTPRLEFGSEPSALASFEIYGGGEGLPVSAALEIASTADGPARVTVPLSLAAQGPGHFLAMGTVPLGALEPGDYLVRGVLRIQDGPTGITTRTLRKVR